jgi:hypothetical protein
MSENVASKAVDENGDGLDVESSAGGNWLYVWYGYT